MGLAGETEAPHPESYQKVRSFLQANPDLIDMAIKALMRISGSTCPNSTRIAIYDHLHDMDSGMAHPPGG
jgi:hypothetical protein